MIGENMDDNGLQTVNISISTPQDVRDMVIEMAKDEDRPISNFISRLIKQEYQRRHPETEQK
jgi:predicted nucleotidyltransferase